MVGAGAWTRLQGRVPGSSVTLMCQGFTAGHMLGSSVMSVCLSPQF